MSHAVASEKPNASSSAAFWAVLIFVGLIIGFINFVQVMSHDEGHGGGHGTTTEHQAPGADHATHGEEAHH